MFWFKVTLLLKIEVLVTVGHPFHLGIHAIGEGGVVMTNAND